MITREFTAKLTARGRALAAAILTLYLSSCGISDIRDATEYWHRLRDKSVSVAGTFLNAAISGDSTAIAAIATDTVTVQVLFLRRRAETEPLIAITRQFRGSEKHVRVFGTGALVLIPYEIEGHQMKAGVETGYVNNRLVVTRFATHVWEN